MDPSNVIARSDAGHCLGQILAIIWVRLLADFRITPVKSGFNTVGLHWSKTRICTVFTLGASLGFIFFTVLIRKSKKQWKVLRDCLKNLPMGIPWDHQTLH